MTAKGCPWRRWWRREHRVSGTFGLHAVYKARRDANEAFGGDATPSRVVSLASQAPEVPRRR